MPLIYVRRDPGEDREEVSTENPFPVSIEAGSGTVVPGGQKRVCLPMVIVPGLDTSAYATDDAVGTRVALTVGCTSGVIESVAFVDLAAQAAAAVDILFFDETFTSVANNAAFDLTDAERGRFVGKISIPAANQTVFGATETIGSVSADVLLPFVAPAGVLYFVVTTQGTPTYAVGDLSLRFTIRQDV